MINDFGQIENNIGYNFKDKTHLKTALTHSSYSNEKMCGVHESYERYEFLGDAILEYLVSEYLFNNYTDLNEGKLTKLRASLVCEYTLSKISRQLELGKYALFSKGEKNTGGSNRDSILCDMFESLLGAVYLDGGIEEARRFVEVFLLTDIEHKQKFYDAKSRLQEYSQKAGKKLLYKEVRTEGPEHEKTFYVQAMINEKVVGNGVGHSKKNAEQEAAYDALEKLEQIGWE